MNKLALNFICKDESHVIDGMLDSAKEIVDLIVAVDTGSSDNTIELIKNFGKENNILTYVFERPFDTFDKCRNYAMDKLRDVVNELEWNSSDTWGFWFDCDEKIIVDPKFNKNQFNKDLYMINTYIGQMKYTRNTFFRVSKPFRWYGVVHEFIVIDDKNITSGLAENIHVDVKMIGSSWQGNIPAKYLSHAHKLETYINEDRKDPRWIFYTAQSYHDSASTKDKLEDEERLRRAMKYYRERLNRTDGYPEEIYYSQYKIGTIMKILEFPWSDSHQELLKAYTIDPLRAESIKTIIDHYLQVGEWHNAYLYSKFAKVNFHGKNPYPKRLLFVDQSLYEWKFLEAHAAACYYTGRMDEAKASYQEILEIQKINPGLFSEQDIQKIKLNGQFFNR
jgi:hypothetical protein